MVCEGRSPASQCRCSAQDKERRAEEEMKQTDAPADQRTAMHLGGKVAALPVST